MKATWGPPEDAESIGRLRFELDLESGKLYKRGMLVPSAGATATDPGHVTGAARLGFDESLNTAVKKLRAAQGDSAENPVFIETCSTGAGIYLRSDPHFAFLRDDPSFYRILRRMGVTL